MGREQRFQLLAQGLPGGILITAGDRIGENRQRHRPESGKTRKRFFLLFIREPLLGLEAFQRPDGRDAVAGLGLLAAGDRGLRYRLFVR
jgi:hypothetical protein